MQACTGRRNGIVQGLIYHAPLHGEIGIGIEGCTAVKSPRHRAMVYYDAVTVMSVDGGKGISNCSGSGIDIPEAETQETDDDIVRIHRYRIAADADSLSRGSLTCYGEVSFTDPQF